MEVFAMFCIQIKFSIFLGPGYTEKDFVEVRPYTLSPKTPNLLCNKWSLSSISQQHCKCLICPPIHLQIIEK